MGSSNKPSDPKKLPVPFTGGPTTDIVHHDTEWGTGREQRGGGKVPSDFTWGSNPKQHQEERGAGEAEKPSSKALIEPQALASPRGAEQRL
jgi:hypothetical protein